MGSFTISTMVEIGWAAAYIITSPNLSRFSLLVTLGLPVMEVIARPCFPSVLFVGIFLSVYPNIQLAFCLTIACFICTNYYICIAYKRDFGASASPHPLLGQIAYLLKGIVVMSKQGTFCTLTIVGGLWKCWRQIWYVKFYSRTPSIIFIYKISPLDENM